MDQYKPGYMGQVMPVDNVSKLTDFVVNKYEAFSKCYDAAKSQSESISSVSAANNKDGDKSFSMKVDTDSKTMESIAESCKDKTDVSVSGNVITAK